MQQTHVVPAQATNGSKLGPEYPPRELFLRVILAATARERATEQQANAAKPILEQIDVLKTQLKALPEAIALEEAMREEDVARAELLGNWLEQQLNKVELDGWVFVRKSIRHLTVTNEAQMQAHFITVDKKPWTIEWDTHRLLKLSDADGLPENTYIIETRPSLQVAAPKTQEE